MATAIEPCAELVRLPLDDAFAKKVFSSAVQSGRIAKVTLVSPAPGQPAFPPGAQIALNVGGAYELVLSPNEIGLDFQGNDGCGYLDAGKGLYLHNFVATPGAVALFLVTFAQ